MEIPPHARRRALLGGHCEQQAGNTSARAEKSCRARRHSSPSRKYLRTRGEEPSGTNSLVPLAEIPPHARRRDDGRENQVLIHGNTSARAEKSWRWSRGSGWWWKYLRTRGEEITGAGALSIGSEIPPHARRRGGEGAAVGVGVGNTSARAEKSDRMPDDARPRWKYLRTRGEEGGCATLLG